MKWNSAANFRDVLLSHRAALSGIWRRSKPGWPPVDRLRLPVLNRPTLGNGGGARFECRVWFKQRHRRRDEDRHAFLAGGASVDDIRPFLHHVATLHLVLCLVVDPTRRSSVLVSQAFFNPIAVESELVQQR